jgi:hypothetical protein
MSGSEQTRPPEHAMIWTQCPADPAFPRQVVLFKPFDIACPQSLEGRFFLWDRRTTCDKLLDEMRRVIAQKRLSRTWLPPLSLGARGVADDFARRPRSAAQDVP